MATRTTRHEDRINCKMKARRMSPNASLIGLSGTPIELTDKNTCPHKYGYPTDKQEKATQTVLEQAEVLSEAWAVA
ncbi:MAG: hypothetical protein HYY12_04400 [Candidatus Methylomirabilis oxyfera]|nr:hypothetical protein [Candidatus Methylomirabilis oxyfera]